MKFHNNSFGRREKKTVFLSFLAAATALQLTSCADRSQIPELPPIMEDTSSVFSDTVTIPTRTEETTSASRTQGEIVSTETSVSEEISETACFVKPENDCWKMLPVTAETLKGFNNAQSLLGQQ